MIFIHHAIVLSMTLYLIVHDDDIKFRSALKLRDFLVPFHHADPEKPLKDTVILTFAGTFAIGIMNVFMSFFTIHEQMASMGNK